LKKQKYGSKKDSDKNVMLTILSFIFVTTTLNDLIYQLFYS